MLVRPLVCVTSMPDAGLLLGSGNRGNQEIINRINNRWSTTGVVFGSSSDPFADRFAEFNRAFVNVAKHTEHLLSNTYGFIMDRNQIIDLNVPDDLAAVPACMQIPILTYAPIRDMFDKGLLYGWGIDKSWLPKEDEYGRMINNGYIGPDPITGIVPDEYEWTWTSTDNEYSIDELEQLAKARQFVDTFILSQLGEGGQLLDPTDYLEGAHMGALK